MFIFLKKKIACFICVCLLLSGALGFTGCDTDGGKRGSLVGIWKYDTAVITVSDTEFKYEDSSYPVYDEIGTVKYHTDYDKQAGVIIFKLTATEKYTAAYWRDLTETTALIATAYKAKGGDGADQYDNTAPADTLDNAKAAFTPAKAGDWVAWSVVQPYTKQ